MNGQQMFGAKRVKRLEPITPKLPIQSELVSLIPTKMVYILDLYLSSQTTA
jgi:hypothetical protein